MSIRPSRALAMALSLLIVVMMTVWAPVMAFADSGNSSAPTEPPGQSAESPGNSEEAPGQVAKAEPVVTTAAPEPAPGNSGDAPGQNKTETQTTTAAPPTSNAGGNSASSGGDSSSSNAGGNSSSNASHNSNKPTTTGGGGASTKGSSTPGSHQTKTTTGSPKGKGDGPTNGVGGNCDGDPSGGSNTGNGANTSGDFDDTCSTSPSGPAPNGNGGGASKGKPCAGCVGNADDKNPPGQSKGDHNNGYECEPDRSDRKGNKGIGKMNPAHTGCTSGGGGDPQYDCLGHLLPNDHNHSADECDPKVTLCHATGSAQNPWTIITISRSALAAHQSHPHVDKAAPISGDPDDCGTVIVQHDCAGHPLPNNHSASECDSPPIVDCDGDGIDDNVDPDISSCSPPPPGEDCDGDGVPDNLDTDLSACDPDELPEFCPDGVTPMPEDGVCDEVLGEIIEKDPKPVFPGGPVVAGEVLGKPEVKAGASVLPFTGGNMLPFLIVSMALMGVGGVSLRRRSPMEEAA